MDEVEIEAALQRFQFPYSYGSIVGYERSGWSYDTYPGPELFRPNLRVVLDSAVVSPMNVLETTLLKLNKRFTASGCITLDGPLSDMVMFFKEKAGGTACVR